MRAYVEILAGLVRVGPQAERYGSPYDFSVAFSAHANFATLKGLSLNRRLTLADYRAVFRACRELGLEPIYERIKIPPPPDGDSGNANPKGLII